MLAPLIIACRSPYVHLLFIEQWNQAAQPFAWTKHSFDKVLAKVERSLPAAQLPLAA